MLADPRRNKNLQRFAEKLGLPKSAAVNWSLLDLALTHPSIDRTANYEQLEFVGDSVIRLIVAELFMEIYPQETVGEFAAIRSILVSDRVLAEFAESFGLEPYVLMANNVAGNPAGRQSWLADVFEAVLGALYLSTHNMSLIRPWLDQTLKTRAEEIRQDPARFNYKDALQEWTQREHKILPQYKVQERSQLTELDSRQIKTREWRQENRFVAEVWFKEQLLGQGSGRSKKAAEQAAAKNAFLEIQNAQG